jgi:hypothetical protein
MYVSGNPKSGAELKRWLEAGRTPSVFPPGLGQVPENGEVALEGPFYPAPHTFYLTGVMENGVLVAVKEHGRIVAPKSRKAVKGRR